MTAKHKLIAALASLCPLAGASWQLASGGFYYDFTGDDEVALARAVDERGKSLYGGVLVVPESVYCDGFTYRVTSVADSALIDSEATLVQLPPSVRRIGTAAFAGSDRLASITLPMGLEAVPPYMLAGTDVADVAIPEGVAVVGEGALRDCVHLHTVFLPSTLTELGEQALAGCYGLFEVYCAAPWPPLTGGSDELHGMDGIDLIVDGDRALERYASHSVWGDDNRFSLWTADDIHLDRAELATDELADGTTRVELGGHTAYKVYGPDGYACALTAAESYYFASQAGEQHYVLAATNMICESSDVLPCAIGHTPTGIALTDDELREPQIVAENGTIHISGDRNGTWTSVYGTDGRLYYQHPTLDTFIDGLPAGRIYIVIVGDVVRKVAL